VAERLGATGPPLGFVSNVVFDDRSTSWRPGDDLLLLFTDGLSDALAERNAARSGETRLVDDVVERRDLPLQEILAHLFRETETARPGTPPDDRTLLLLRG
jgi:serine phosphatase RsbU (regulator of sigma subunit)